MYFGQKVFNQSGVVRHGGWKAFETQRDAYAAGCTLISVLELCCTVKEYEAWIQAHRDADRDPSKQRLHLPFRGPFYLDFDAPDRQEELKQALIDKLIYLNAQLAVDEGDMHLFFSGNKGFHLEIPAEVFGRKNFQHAHLPSLYRNLLIRLGLDGLADMNVYSESRGRLWRAPGRLRENGYRKIPLTWRQFTKLSFKQIKVMSRLKQTRHFITRQPPRFSKGLSDLFDEVLRQFEEEAPKRRARTAKAKARRRQLFTQSGNTPRLPKEARAEIEAALVALPDSFADAYDSWVRIGMSLYTGTEGSNEGLELWSSWSRRSAKFDAEETALKWASFQTDDDNVIGLGTLFYLADRYS